MNLKEKLIKDYPQLSKLQIENIIEESNKKITEKTEKEIVEGNGEKPKGLRKIEDGQ